MGEQIGAAIATAKEEEVFEIDCSIPPVVPKGCRSIIDHNYDLGVVKFRPSDLGLVARDELEAQEEERVGLPVNFWDFLKKHPEIIPIPEDRERSIFFSGTTFRANGGAKMCLIITCDPDGTWEEGICALNGHCLDDFVLVLKK